MTATIETRVVLSCDVPGCVREFGGNPNQPASEVRRIAAMTGWAYVPPSNHPDALRVESEADYCRVHTPPT